MKPLPELPAKSVPGIPRKHLQAISRSLVFVPLHRRLFYTDTLLIGRAFIPCQRFSMPFWCAVLSILFSLADPLHVFSTSANTQRNEFDSWPDPLVFSRQVAF
jgi:hypothetical protein